jgi:MFS family permease
VTSMLASRIGNRRVVMIAAFGSMLSLLPLALIPHWVAAAIGFVGVVAFSWMRYAASVVYFMEQVPRSRRATLSGATEMASGVCFTVLSFGGGFLASLFGYRILFLLGAVLVLLSGVVFWMFFHNRPGSDELARSAR